MAQLGNNLSEITQVRDMHLETVTALHSSNWPPSDAQKCVKTLYSKSFLFIAKVATSKP